MSLTWLKQWGMGALMTIGSLILKIWFKSCRPKILQDELHKEFFLGSRQFIGVSWHRGSIYSCYFFGRFHPLVMFSQSQDGEYLARFAQKCGIIPVRSSSSRGGQKALLQMIRSL